jgi:hypothetical protein
VGVGWGEEGCVVPSLEGRERRNSKRKERLKRKKTNDLNNKKTDKIEINKQTG